jgi:hypothetical protein
VTAPRAPWPAGGAHAGYLEREARAAHDFRGRLLAACATYGMQLDPRRLRRGDEQVFREIGRFALGLALADLVADLRARAAAAGSPRAPERAVAAVDRISAILGHRFLETDLRILVEWCREAEAYVRAACLTTRTRPVVLSEIVSACRQAVARAVAPAIRPASPADFGLIAHGVAVRPRDAAAPWLDGSPRARAREAGCRAAVVEVEIPGWWMAAPARPFEEDAPLTRTTDCRWAATWLPEAGDVEVCRMPAGAAGGDALVVGAFGPPEDEGDGPRRRLVVFEPGPHLRPEPDVLAQADVDGGFHGFRLAASRAGHVYAAWFGEAGLALAVADRGAWRTLLERDYAVSGAWFLPFADPVLVWCGGPRLRPGEKVCVQPWAVRVAQPDAMFRWPLSGATLVEGASGGTLPFVSRAPGGLLVAEGGPYGEAKATLVRDERLASGGRLLGAAMRADGTICVLWADRRETVREWSFPRWCREVVVDEGVYGALIAGGRVERTARLAGTSIVPVDAARETVAFAGLAAGASLCLATRFGRTPFAAGDECPPSAAHVAFRIYDGEFRPVTGARAPRVLLDLGGDLRERVRLVPRADGSVSLIAVAGVGPREAGPGQGPAGPGRVP